MKKYLLTFQLLLCTSVGFSQQQFQPKEFTASNGQKISYQELEPQNKKKRVIYPLVLFLHGGGERGADNSKQLTHGAAMFENPVNRERYPAFVLFPQCPDDGYWAYENRPISFQPDSMPLNPQPTPLIQGVRELLESYIKRPDIDSKRIYIIGLSMGGMATYDLVGRYPDLFTAAVSICGTVNPQRLLKTQDVVFRLFHGDQDDTVPVAGSREAYQTLQKIGADVEYIEMPGINHLSWYPAFNRSDFMEWLFDQAKGQKEDELR